MATALVLIALGIAVLLRGRKLADAAINLQEGTSSPSTARGPAGPFEPPRAPGEPARGRLPLPGLPSIPYPVVIDPRKT